jgi:hypothetical protein
MRLHWLSAFLFGELTERHCEERSNLYAIQRNPQVRPAYVEIASFLAMTWRISST